MECILVPENNEMLENKNQETILTGEYQRNKEPTERAPTSQRRLIWATKLANWCWIITQSMKWISVRPYWYKKMTENIWGEVISLLCRKIQNNLYRYSTLKLFSPKCNSREEGEEQPSVENHDKHYVGWSRLRSTVWNYVDSKYSWCNVIKMARYLCGLSLNNPITLSDDEKNIRQIPTVEPSTKYLTSTPQNCRGHQNQAKSEKLSQLRGA